MRASGVERGFLILVEVVIVVPTTQEPWNLLLQLLRSLVEWEFALWGPDERDAPGRVRLILQVLRETGKTVLRCLAHILRS
jgi:hypothetical protein